MSWVLEQNWALIDVNVLAHNDVIGQLDQAAVLREESSFVQWVWDHIIQ